MSRQWILMKQRGSSKTPSKHGRQVGKFKFKKLSSAPKLTEVAVKISCVPADQDYRARKFILSITKDDYKVRVIF